MHGDYTVISRINFLDTKKPIESMGFFVESGGGPSRT